MPKKILKVGFDLDGVILYNPARIVRPITSVIKRVLLHKKGLIFYYPKSHWEKTFWRILHLSSFITAPGLSDLVDLAKSGKIEAYIITARFDFLKNDFHSWIKKINGDKFLKGYYHNSKNEQPHIFKEKMIKKLNLDIYVEDNWDIVNYLEKKNFEDGNKQRKIVWIYNFFDRQIKYKDRFPILRSAIKMIRTNYLT
ncbi:hypothetical protein AUK04_01480 [Candidatus Roizmanbacteria bacterium CG2_30_33_16]|uniref:FCP1 homology domain-containing protein n=4 Tax=Candidatus Roizmaniibacteriota TaxID=1752723 RepID=A0A2M7E5I5_9BACT|nr:MAG: hypothetical protein AUK04_01480 [Candidatus Roizmanbacteria bacterium CG2_30_33_16]PIV62975.1 MAG: hypothetical protein COS12_00300 [Candidatus Roizmanbacteria bacterium CG01_land_8_20_14_3_00_33_9]PIX73921.1 MAG: hypothetical protein COZ39_01370 [Candidatus Roizmanbacteria bacterium CG_4_10_14_3_um_filter_33_21]PJB89593.1 MAG: hypothetical protein CO083_00515 [Candidatus Roizmanbacteria bacterium CG_4_9_14_0_8_um_filter_34_12]